MSQAPNLLDIDTAARHLSCTPETVRRMLRRGELRGVKLGRLWRVPMEVLRRLETPALTEAAPVPLAPDESARRLAALDTLGQNLPDHRADAGLPPLDLSGERGDVYGYNAREDAQR